MWRRLGEVAIGRKDNCIAKVQRTADDGQVWSPPQVGFTKINVEAALPRGSNHVQLGAVARDHMGSGLVSYRKQPEFLALRLKPSFWPFSSDFY
ncbi:hypothetical protein SLE2022_295270 [Rubroshorea leprosula]